MPVTAQAKAFGRAPMFPGGGEVTRRRDRGNLAERPPSNSCEDITQSNRGSSLAVGGSYDSHGYSNPPPRCNLCNAELRDEDSQERLGVKGYGSSQSMGRHLHIEKSPYLYSADPHLRKQESRLCKRCAERESAAKEPTSINAHSEPASSSKSPTDHSQTSRRSMTAHTEPASSSKTTDRPF